MTRVRSVQSNRRPLNPRQFRRRRPFIEILEQRQLLTTDTWINPAGGSWDVASNWNDGLPGATDDAIIGDLNAAAAVTISSKLESVNSVTATGQISISGGGLAVAATSTISGGLTMTGGSLEASGAAISLTVTGTTAVSVGSLYARGGATLSLPELASYMGGQNYVASTFQASGAGSVLSLPALTTIGWNSAVLSS
jgi:hypothetical protein